MYIPPIDYCSHAKCYVEAGQTQEQCAQQHECLCSASECPLLLYLLSALDEKIVYQYPRYIRE